MNQQQFDRLKNNPGFIAALDQSGGSTPKALLAYGVDDTYYKNEEEMFERVHEMRTRIIKNESFNGDKILGAILFERTMNSEIDGMPTAQYLWEEKKIVPFLKIDKGLEEERDGVQRMKEIPDLDALLDHAVEKGIFGTKMRSLIHSYNEPGIRDIVRQQFAVAKKVIAKGLVPIIEPEVAIDAEEKDEIETFLRSEILKELHDFHNHEQVMLKLTIPSHPNRYKKLVKDKNVLRVVALSGGYSQTEANDLLRKNDGLIASFSRALAEGLSIDQNDEQFGDHLTHSIDAIYDASTNKVENK